MFFVILDSSLSTLLKWVCLNSLFHMNFHIYKVVYGKFHPEQELTANELDLFGFAG